MSNSLVVMIDQHNQMSSVLENALDAVVAMDTKGFITEWNKQAEAMLGWKKEEAIGRRMSETIIPHRYREAHEKGLRNFLITGQGLVINNRLELSALRRDGVEIPIELTVTHVKSPKYECFYAFVRDITERINFRERILKNQEQLEQALKTRDEFISITSHELKNPLSVLNMKTQIMKRHVRKNDEIDIEGYLNHVEDQVVKLTRLVEEMLDVSRIRTGRLTMEWEEFNLTSLMQDLLDKMKEQFMIAHCGVPVFKFNSGDVTGTWDKLRIEQVMMNLFTNVIRYASGRPVEVELMASEDTVLIKVKDHGEGISKEQQFKIFDPFERASDPSEVKSLGLGLYITKQIVEAHHGQIWVESTKGKGATFCVKLPIVHGKEGQVEAVELH